MTYDEYLKKYTDLYAGQKNDSVNKSNALYDKQKKDVSTNYNTQIDVTKNQYEDQYRENAVQKLINERQVAENMANLGLTDSGLNRTQQTAVQLSYANNRTKIDTVKQQAVDKLSTALADAISQIDINKTAAADSIEDSYYQLAAKNAQAQTQADQEAETARYKAALEAETARQKAAYEYNAKASKQTAEDAEASEPVYYKYGYKDPVTSAISYKNSKTGKDEEFEVGVNPYTGKKIGGYTSEQIEHYGVWNGYQPKGVVADGIDYGKVQLADSGAVNYQGHNKNVFKTTQRGRNGTVTTRYWVWDDYKNGGSYTRVYQDKDGDWCIEG